MEKRRYRLLADFYRNAIQSGTLLHGQRLPSLRQLTQQHGLSLSTVLQAMRLLEQQGWLEARNRTGYFVSCTMKLQLSPLDEPDIYRARHPDAYSGIHERISEFVVQRGFLNQATDFSGMGASPEFYPIEALKTVATKLLRQQPQLLAQVNLGQADKTYQEAIARHAQSLGMQLSPNEIVATHGAKDSVGLALQAITQVGDKIAVESPTYFGLLQVIESLGLQPIEIPTSPTTGMLIEALAQALHLHPDIKAVIVVPHLQNPLGAIMPVAHKKQLLQLCASQQVVIIEDDVYSGLMANPAAPIKSFDATGDVIYCGSFNKTLAPGIRLGWLAAGRWQARIEMLKFARGTGDSVWMQAIVAQYINSGRYERHLRQFRINIAQQRRHMLGAIGQYFPVQTKLNHSIEGLAVWLKLPDEVDVEVLSKKALNEGIGVCLGTMLSNTRLFERHIRISCGKVFTEETRLAIRRLGELCKGDFSQKSNFNFT